MPPLNLVGDFGGGALLPRARHRRARCSRRGRSGKGQVVDAAMVDGAASLDDADSTACTPPARGPTSAAPTCSTPARPSTSVYETSDGGYVSRRRRSKRSSTRSCSQLHRAVDRGPAASSMDREPWPEMQGAVRRGLQDADARRVVRAHGGHRRLLRARARSMAEAPRAPAPAGARHLRRGRRRGPARTGAALQPHAARRSSAARRQRGRAHRRGARATGASMRRSGRRCAPPARFADLQRLVAGRKRSALAPSFKSNRRSGRERNGSATAEASAWPARTLDARRARRGRRCDPASRSSPALTIMFDRTFRNLADLVREHAAARPQQPR